MSQERIESSKNLEEVVYNVLKYKKSIPIARNRSKVGKE